LKCRKTTKRTWTLNMFSSMLPKSSIYSTSDSPERRGGERSKQLTSSPSLLFDAQSNHRVSSWFIHTYYSPSFIAIIMLTSRTGAAIAKTVTITNAAHSHRGLSWRCRCLFRVGCELSTAVSPAFVIFLCLSESWKAGSIGR